MAIYRINQRTSLFKGRRGDLIETEPGPMVNSMVTSGAISRIDTEPVAEKLELEEEPKAEPEEESLEGKPKKTRRGS